MPDLSGVPGDRPPGPAPWDLQADVVIVGFGAAGACAALEAAAAGARVIVIDRFSGGGSTALSGGVVYAGGGTLQQIQAGVRDTPEAMFGYLRHEVGGAVSEATLRDFCDNSAQMLAWLASKGVPFEGSLCPDKTSYPGNRHYLYYSGSELSLAGLAPPAPRGHRAVGRGTSGRVLFAGLAGAVAAAGVTVLPQTTAVELVTGADGRVTGLACRSLGAAPAWARFAHRTMHRLGKKAWLYGGSLGRRLHAPVAWTERCYGRPLRIGAGEGVILAAGGFVANRAMLRQHAPAYRGGLALGTVADDGSGIALGLGPAGWPACSTGCPAGGSSLPRQRSCGASWWTRPGGASATSPGTVPRSARRWCASTAGGPGLWSTGISCPARGGSWPAAPSGSSSSRPHTC